MEWLGQVPAHWTLTSLRRVSNEWCDGPFGSGLKSTHYVDAGVRVIRLQNIRAYGFDDSDAAFIEEAYYRTALGDHDVVAGDLLLAGLGDENNTVGRACVAPVDIEPALVKADCFRFRLDSGVVLPHFAALQLTAGAAFDAGILSSGSTRSRIPLSVMASRALVLPTLEEQRAIASFLDRETAKIDALAAEQERLIALLKLKRQAVISHAVTKGLNPDVPMTGVIGLGMVPAHWTVTVIKRFSTLQRGHDLTDAERTEGPYPVVTSSGISGTHGDFVARAPGVVTGRYGSTGRLFFIENDYWPHNTALYVNNFHSNEPRFVWYHLQSVDFSAHSAKAAVPGIDRNDIHVLAVGVPPISEQRRIAEYLDSQTSRIDALLSEQQDGIDLLLERRAALITAAVTGQIDVRGLAPAEAA